MADVVAGKKIIRRPIGFKDRRIEALLRELVFIGVNQVGVAMVLEPFDVLEKRIRLEHIIVIEKADPFSFREGETAI